MDHAVDASKRCAPALVGMGIELLLGKDVTASLANELVLEPVHMFRCLQRIPHTRRRPCRINTRLVRLCCVAKRWRLVRDISDSTNKGIEKYASGFRESNNEGGEYWRDEMGPLGIFEQKVDCYLFWYAEASAMRLVRPSASGPCVLWGINQGQEKEG